MTDAPTALGPERSSVSDPIRMSVSELRAITENTDLKAGKDFIVVDVRRTDMDVRLRSQISLSSYITVAG